MPKLVLNMNAVLALLLAVLTNACIVATGNAAYANIAPEVDAGAGETGTLSTAVFLSRTGTDDGLAHPPGAMTNLWSQVSGSGTVAFAEATVVDNAASFSESGTYGLRLTGHDGEFMVSAELTATVGFRFVSWADTKSSVDELSSLSNQAVLLNPTFTIYEGDLESDGFTLSGMNAWKDAMNGYSSNGMFDKTLPVRGNHDQNHTTGWQKFFDMQATAQSLGATNYSALGEDLTYSFDSGNSHFIGVDVLGDADLLTPEQVGWIDSDLAAAEARGLTHAFVYFHGPIYCLDGHCSCTTRVCPLDSIVVSLIEVLNNHPIVSATFHGHEHTYAYVHIDDTRIPEVTHPFEQFVTGSAGAGPNDCIAERTDYCMPSNGFVTVDVSGDTFTVEFYELGTVSPVRTMAFSKSGNRSPTVHAGPDQMISLLFNAALDGTVTDDGLPNPPGVVTTLWSQVSGPEGVTFADATAVDTTASFSEAGSYVLKLAANDGELTIGDEIIVTVNPISTITVPQDYATIQAAVDAAQNGDLVLVSPGTYAENIVLSGKTIVLASEFYTTQDPSFIDQTIVDGGGLVAITVDASVGPETKLVGFTIQGGTDGVYGAGHLEILHNRFVDNGDAIDYEGGGGICRYNVFENNTDDAVDLDGATQAIIEDNVIRNNGDDGIEIRLHNYTGAVLNTIIRDNVISNNGEDGIQVIDYPGLSDRFILIERNLVQGNVMAGLGLMDNGETVEDYRAASIPERIHVFNNTFVDNDYGLSGGDNLIALNNLFVDSAELAMKEVDGNSVAAYNLFWDNGTDEQGSNLDLGTTLFVDPFLGSEYRLQPGSPAIDAGTAYFQWEGETVLDLADTEFCGEAPDLGANESGCGARPTVIIDTPAGGASFEEGTPINFSGSAVDAEDGDLTIILSWSSDVDGGIGAGGTFSRSDLVPATHTITASVTDSDSLTGVGQITITVTPAPPDTDPPTPDPMTWAQVPTATGTTAISMTATLATDRSGVEYYFECTAGGGYDSGWQDGETYQATGLQPEMEYTYRVKARDKSPNRNETGWSSEASATTEALSDTDPPTPDPMTWAQVPVATGTTSISMTATTATDESGVEYYFECTTGGCYDSGWQGNPVYEDTGLQPGTEYSYRVKVRDKSPNRNETGWSSAVSATTEAPLDTDPPTPDPMTWARVPAATGTMAISMTATLATDVSGVEYYFDCTAGGCYDSGWQDGPVYEDNGLQPATEYSYRVKARDKSPNRNETGWSSEASATTEVLPDTDPPTPDPMTWAQVPTATEATAISMTATLATDVSGVEYYFDCTAGGGYDSGWQDSPVYEDTGLQPETEYTYRVKARDRSPNRNETGWSSAVSATTEALPDTDPPTPDPMTWAQVPVATGTTAISMTATLATDVSGVEYYFECTAGGGNDSGWQDSPVYEDTSLQPETEYTYRVKARDKSPNRNETGWSSAASATTEAPPDTDPPTPDPMTWAQLPVATGATAISMTATLATDKSGVEYYFECTAGGGNDSGWQDSPVYEDMGLQPETEYTYRVKARDKSPNRNETGWSSEASATTEVLPDTDPPTPDPMTWARVPTATGTTAISMTATLATDVSGVEYYFECTAGGGNDSGWQDSPVYEDTGLQPGTEYSYRVKARDKSPNRNETGWSSAVSATTEALPDTDPPTPDPMTWAQVPTATGATAISMTATLATDKSGVEYYFECTAAGGNDSGWQDSPVYKDTGLQPETEYTYRVKARDKSPNRNETGWSSEASATTEVPPDTDPPTPDPMKWEQVPTATGANSISMTATLATDVSGVQYYFDCMADGGHDSGWQDSPVYEDTGLQSGTEYSYRVKARDKSPNRNETGWSSEASATTEALPDTDPPTPDPMTWAQVPTATGATVISMTATIATDVSGAEYYFDCTSGGCYDSGWQGSPMYEDTGLHPGIEYTYRVKARDKSPNRNETGWSSAVSATTEVLPHTLTYLPFVVKDYRGPWPADHVLASESFYAVAPLGHTVD